MSYPRRELLLRLGYFIAGVAITAVGAAIFVLTATGTDPFGVLMQGTARLLGVSNGTAHMGLNATFLLLILCFARKYIHVGTFASLVVIGPMIDLSTFLLRGFIGEWQPLALRLAISAGGVVLIAFGLSGIINASVGVGANDLISIILSDRLHRQFRWVRIAVDASFVLIGWPLGGVVGIGTVFCVLLIGPVSQFFVPHTGRLLAHLLRRFGE